MHGSSAGQVRRAAKRRLEEARVNGELAALLAECGAAEDADPLEVLLGRIATARAMCRALETLIGGLALRPRRVDADGEADPQGDYRAEAIYGPDHLGDLRRHPLEAMLGEWTDRAGRLSKLALDAGVDAKRLELAEAMQAMTAAWVTAVFGDPALGLSDAQRDALPALLERHITTAIDAESRLVLDAPDPFMANDDDAHADPPEHGGC